VAAPEDGTLTLRAEHAELRVAAALGGRITSLRDLRSGHEWLAQPAGPPVGSTYGAVFTAGDMAGWDEMVPTIVACDAPGVGVALPDHGEAWAVPWQVHRHDPTQLRMSVRGSVLAYELVRTIEVAGPAAFALRYVLRSRHPGPLPILWAAHPQFVWTPGTRIELEPHVTQVVEVTAPGCPLTDWEQGLAAWLDSAAVGASRKVWLPPDAAPSQVGLAGPQGRLQLAWDPTEVPYLGIWYDAQAHARTRVVALEPSTGYYDDLAAAAARGRVPVLEPGRPQRWSLRVSVQPPVPTR